jgi:hypothetical protein
MKKTITLLTALITLVGANAQTNVNLKLNHYWNGDVFNYGQTYTDHDGRAVSITRVQYYLSDFDLTHDGAQTTNLQGTYVLASGNITDYSLGTSTLTNLEAIDFDLGVDAATNHLDPANYNNSHPLALQNPQMHWGWTAGYRFLVIEGKVDSDDDGTPNKSFQFHVVADDSYLTPVTAITTSGTTNGTDLDINVDVNIADWVYNVNLITAGFNHGVYPVNGTLMANTNTYSVFSANIGLSLANSPKLKHNIYFDCTQAYAPTIYYKIPSAKSIKLTIIDINGKVVLVENGLAKAGNYFINTELESGTYVASFETETGAIISEKFIVQQ